MILLLIPQQGACSRPGGSSVHGPLEFFFLVTLPCLQTGPPKPGDYFSALRNAYPSELKLYLSELWYWLHNSPQFFIIYNQYYQVIRSRFYHVIPTTIAILLGLDPLNILVYSQVILSIMIPIPMIPLVFVTRDKKLMGEFVNRKLTTLLAIIFVGIILVFNSYLLFSTICA